MRMNELLRWLEESAELPDVPIDPKRIDLQREYAKLNKKFFDGKLGMYPMKWNRRKTAGALVKWTRQRNADRSITCTITSIEVSTYYQSTILRFVARLVHEMIHVFLLEQNIDDGHGRLFKAEMNRINRMNPGFEVKLREDATNFAMTAKAKGKKVRRGVLLYDGGDGIVVFGPKHFADTLYELVSFPDRFLQAHKFEWYWVDDPEFARYPAKRKIGNRFGT